MPASHFRDHRFGLIPHYAYPFDNFPSRFPDVFSLGDHLGGIDTNGKNPVLDEIQRSVDVDKTVLLSFYPTVFVQKNYQNLKLLYAIDYQDGLVFSQFDDYKIHPELNFKNFLCSFNGSAHVSRQLLVAILIKAGWFVPGYSSKNFSFDADTIDGHLFQYVGDQTRFYRKFFIGNLDFFLKQFSFGHERYRHRLNIHNLETPLTSSFLHLVSESMATSYHPFVTEKFLYSVVTRGLFLSYAQPGWHDHLEHYYGFRKYDKIFDYRFDSIFNPVERLVELMSMISKFSALSSDDWCDLYDMEIETIEHNYDWYFSKNYLKRLNDPEGNTPMC